jgi:hypothetical protein
VEVEEGESILLAQNPSLGIPYYYFVRTFPEEKLTLINFHKKKVPRNFQAPSSSSMSVIARRRLRIVRSLSSAINAHFFWKLRR